MNANIVLSVKGRKVFFNPHETVYKWKIYFPIDRIEIMCKNSHYFESVSYVPQMCQNEMLISVECDNWELPKCDRVILPMCNSIILTNQIQKELFNDCQSIIRIPKIKIEQYIVFLRGDRK